MPSLVLILIRAEGTGKVWNQYKLMRKSPSERELERERKRMLAKLYPSSVHELVRVAAESKLQPTKLSPEDRTTGENES